MTFALEVFVLLKHINLGFVYVLELFQTLIQAKTVTITGFLKMWLLQGNVRYGLNKMYADMQLGTREIAHLVKDSQWKHEDLS